MTVVGTRPEIIRLSRVMSKLDESEAIEHITVHTGQNYDYELNEIFYEDLDIRKPDYFLNAAGANAIATIGQILINIDPILEEVKPDAFLVLGDTNSCLCAIPAKKRHIPIFHMEAGNRCFDQRVPEETNRKIVDHIADINLTYSSIAREYLLREGLPADRIIKTGSPMFEVLNHYMPKIQASDVLTRLGLEKEKYFVVSAHREENINNEKNFKGLIDSLNLIAKKFGFPIIVSTHPRTRKRLEQAATSNTSPHSMDEAFGFFGLQRPTNKRKRYPLRFRHHLRRIFHFELPRTQHPRSPRTARSHGRNLRHDGWSQSGKNSARTGTSSKPKGWGGKKLQSGWRILNAECK